MHTTIEIRTSDSIIWNQDQVTQQLCQAMHNRWSIALDLCKEGPDCNRLNLEPLVQSYCDIFDYNINDIELHTCNALETSDKFNIKYTPPSHFVDNTKKKLNNTVSIKNFENIQHFGMFIGRGNHLRLDLASYLNLHHEEKTIQTYHYDQNIAFHRENIGLEEHMRNSGTDCVDQLCKFLQKCPIKTQSVNYPILMDHHLDITPVYQNFFVEIVCETYFSGDTFFTTEKIWRPIALKTPFIVQGPVNFLHNLRRLGFKTFNSWWNEGYSEDPNEWQVKLIKELIDMLATKTKTELKKMYDEMVPVLEHNHQRLMTLTEQDFLELYYDH
jgi:hypothetical protein